MCYFDVCTTYTYKYVVGDSVICDNNSRVTMTGWNWRLGGWRTMKLEGEGRRKVARLCRESGELFYVYCIQSHYTPSFQKALISKGIISNRQAEKTESSFHTQFWQEYLD